MKKIALFAFAFAPAVAHAGALSITDAQFFGALAAMENAVITDAMKAQMKANEAASSDPLPNELQYTLRSVELPAIQLEVYQRAAEKVLPRIQHADKPWAVVLDVDETVLDNSDYQIEVLKTGKGFEPSTWDAWTKRRAAKAVPGAREFLDQVRSVIRRQHGFGRIVFITDRNANQESDTAENLKALGLFDPETDSILAKRMTKEGREDGLDTKEARRQCVQNGKNGDDERCKGWASSEIDSLFGDSLRDFFEVYGADAYTKGAPQLEQCIRWERCFVLPNVMYGKWQPQGANAPYEKFKPKPRPEAAAAAAGADKKN